MDRSGRTGGLLSGAVSLDRRQFIRGAVATGAVVSASGLIAACSSGSSTSSSSTPAAVARKRGGNLTVGLSGSSGADTLDPHAGLTYVDSSRALSLYESLLQLDENAQPQLVLAESIEANSPTQFTIKLRQGIKFHSGKELGAEDVIWSFTRILTKKSPQGIPFSGLAALGPMDVKGLKALDKYTVQVPFTSPYGTFETQLAYWYYLFIIPDGYDPAANPNSANGTGPFKFSKWTKNVRSTVVRNENYWQSGLPYVDSVTVIDFPDTTSLQNALTTGEIDAAGGFDGPQLAALNSVTGVKTVASKSGGISPFTMMVTKAPFSDVNVRQALRLLIDRPQMIDSALDGYGTVGNDVSSPYDPDFDTSLHREQDIPQAKFLLKKAGMEDLKLTLVTSAVSTGLVAMATVMAEQAQAAGVTITLNNIQPPDFFNAQYLHRPFSQDYYNYNPYLAQVATSMLGSNSPYNETGTNSPTLNSLYAEANQTVNNPAKVKQIVQEMMRWDFNNGGYIIPAYIDALDAYSTKITGYSQSKVGLPMSDMDFQNWSFV